MYDQGQPELPDLSRAPKLGTTAFEFFRELCRSRLPYGMWVDATGRQVLFNRRYQPIWQREPGAKAKTIDPGEHIPYVSQIWFYNDGCTPWHNAKSRWCCLRVLQAWGAERLHWGLLDWIMRRNEMTFRLPGHYREPRYDDAVETAVGRDTQNRRRA